MEKEKFAIVINLIISLCSIFLSGCISFFVAYFTYKTEDKKIIIKQRHELVLKEIAPKLYTPLLNILFKYENAKKDKKIDYSDIRKVINENSALLLYIPEDISIIIKKMRIESSVINDDTENTIYDLLKSFNEKLEAELKVYVLKGK